MSYTAISYGSSKNEILKWMHSKWAHRRGRAYILRILLKLFPRLNTISLRIHNYLLPLDLRNDADIGYFYANGIGHEKFYQEILIAIVTKDTVFYDVGSNLGYYSILLSPLVKNVVSFEPNPYLSARLTSAVEANEINNIKVLKVGLSNESTQMTFYFDNSNHVLGSFVKNDQHTETMNISVATLDSLIENSELPPPDIIKIDTEGYELQVLQGFKTLRQYKPILIVEWISQRNNEDEMIGSLFNLIGDGYKVYKIGHNDQLVLWSRKDFSDYSDLLLIPEMTASRELLKKWMHE